MVLRRLLPTLEKTPLDWLFEGLLIVVSVVLGMWVSQYQQARADHELVARVLDSLQKEIEHNLETLDAYQKMHARWVATLSSVDTRDAAQSGLDLLFATRPALPPGAKSPFPFLRRSAWDAALAGGAMRLVDNDVAAALSDVYRLQEVVVDNVNRLAGGVLTSLDFYQPTNRVAAARMLGLTIADIQSAESSTVELYRRHLPLIRAASAR